MAYHDHGHPIKAFTQYPTPGQLSVINAQHGTGVVIYNLPPHQKFISGLSLKKVIIVLSAPAMLIVHPIIIPCLHLFTINLLFN